MRSLSTRYSCRGQPLAGLLLFICLLTTAAGQTITTKSEQHNFNATAVVSNLANPWGMAFLPNGEVLVTERPGRLRLIQNGQLVDEAITGLPLIKEYGQGGLLGIALHPDFNNNHLLYLSYAGVENGNRGTEVLRGRLDGLALTDTKVIFKALPKRGGPVHFGSRLVFAPDGTLFISLGDRGASPAEGTEQPAQRLDDHLGSLIRINDDGSVPRDNPFVENDQAMPEIFTLGNRNMQGMALNPATREIWTHEHGPQGGDEINIMRAGKNYGWPVITYGVNYGIGTKIGEGTHKEGMEQPLYKWVPSIAPSGMMFYTGDKFPQWQGDLFVGSLKFALLVRLELDGNQVVAEERLLTGVYGRIRDVVQGPDGYIYLLTDAADGKLLKITPAD
ncbi:MAG: glucose dehydrogenase [Gammaproteobacteria bacterium]|nr:glucose dehydrogenase [Gammaproteobacteria bacterium]